MEGEGFRIQGISFDLGNKTLMSQTGLDYTRNHYFKNPFDEKRKVFMFPDAPHLIKLARNHLFDYGFRVPAEDGTLVPLVKKDFEDVLAKNRGGSELRTVFSLSRAHLDVKGSQRQRVRLAVQTLSNRVAEAMLEAGPQNLEYKAKYTAVKLFNDWFDVMNAKSRNDKNPLSRGMSPEINGAKQLLILDNMEQFLLKFHVMDTAEKQYAPKSKQPWQHGFMCSIKATKEIYLQLVVNTGTFQFILTAKFNQDCLENLFSRLRALGGDNCHPTPIEALRRMRILLLVSGADLLISRPSVEMEPIQMEDENGDPVSDEDIANQKIILEQEKYNEDEIEHHKERKEFLDREIISSQVVTNEDFPTIAEQDNIDTQAENLNVFEADLAAMEAEEREEEERKNLERDQKFTKIPRAVFNKSFFHSSSTNETINFLNQNKNTDIICFDTPVIITAVTLVPDQTKLHIAYPQDQTILGKTFPNRFALELYCNDVSVAADDKASYLDSMNYDVDAGICTINFPQNNTVSNQLVLQGNYTNMTVMVIGKVEKKNDRESQGLGYVAGFVAKKDIENNEKKEERRKKELEKELEKGKTRKRKIEEIEPKPFVPLGKKTKKFTYTEANDSLTPWIFAISRGGLVVPDNEFFLDSEKFEEEFNAFHGSFLPPTDAYCIYGQNEEIKKSSKEERYFPFKKGPRIIDGLTDILFEKFGDKYDRRVLADFSKTRLNIRVRAAKIKLAEDNAERLEKNRKRRQTVRELKQLGQLTNSGTREYKQLGQFTN